MNKNYFNYFLHISNKYNLSLSSNKPLILFLDGKHITANNMYNLNNEALGSFNDNFEKTIKYFSKKYNCMAIYGVDEVSFILENTSYFKNDCKLTNLKSHDITSIFSQKFFEQFKKISKDSVYWHCKTTNIPKGKINSYLKYRSSVIFQAFTTYFLKHMNIKNAGQITKIEKLKLCNSFEDYKNIKKFEKGHLYINGNLIDLDSYLNQGKIVKLFEIEREDLFTNFFK